MDKLQQQFQERPDLARGFIMTELQTLCWAINETTEYCAFYRFSGHVNLINLHITKNKEDIENRVLNYMLSLTDNWYYNDESLTPYEAYLHVKEELIALLPKEVVEHEVYSKS